MSDTQTPTGEQVKDKAQEAAGEARDRVRGEIDSRSTQAGEQVTTHGKDLRSVGDALREQGQDGPAKLADQAAHHVERAGSWLTESDADRIIGDVEDFGRKNPWAVVAGGVALGFAASRMLKASSTDRYNNAQRAPAPRQPTLPTPMDPAAARPVAHTPAPADRFTPGTPVPGAV